MVGCQRVGAQQKTEVATECGCTTSDVENVVAKYEWAKEANRRVLKLKEEGKPLPKSLNEVSSCMGCSVKFSFEILRLIAARIVSELWLRLDRWKR